MWEYTVLATNVTYPLESVSQLPRDRCDCENGFDELKNQWGLSGFTTQDINSCQTTARAGALVYNWWSWYCRAAHPGARLEAITSPPLLLAAVGKATSHAALQHVRVAAEQLAAVDRWATLLRYICQRIALPIPQKTVADSYRRYGVTAGFRVIHDARHLLLCCEFAIFPPQRSGKSNSRIDQ